jgi:hypothetical protein
MNKKIRCDNDSAMGSYKGVMQCFKGEPMWRVTVYYNFSDSDTMVLCEECKEAVKKDARKYDYTVSGSRL